MTSSIQQKISRCIQALNVENLQRLQANMNVIEGYIQRKPIFLEWLHSQLIVDDRGVPREFSDRFYSSHVDTVRVWFLTMHALCGDMCIQGVDHLNLSAFKNIRFPSQMKDCFELSKLWLPDGFSGEPPPANMYWVYTSNLEMLYRHVDLIGKYTLILNGSPPDTWDTRIVTSIYGLDGSQVSPEVWQEWLILLEDAPIEQCAFPETLTHLEVTPKWFSMLKIAKMPPGLSLCQFKDWHLSNSLEVLCLRNELRIWSKWRVENAPGLVSLPDWVLQLTQLRWLDISMNPIQEMPADLERLRKLQTLNVANTDLKKFPDVLLELTDLEQLFIRSTNASVTREWLKELSGRNTDLRIQRVVHQDRLSLWDLCLDAEQCRD